MFSPLRVLCAVLLPGWLGAQVLTPILTNRANWTVQSVPTVGYSNARLGAQPSEGKITPANVASMSVKCTIVPPDGGWVWHQPLIATGVSGRNLLIVGTMQPTGGGAGGDNLYAFDESSCSNTPVWTLALGTPFTQFGAFFGSGLYNTGYGILSAPVIDQANNLLFVVNFTADGAFTPNIYVNKVNLATGALITQRQLTSAISVPGVGCNSSTAQPWVPQTGCDSYTENTSGGNLLFSPAWQNQRSAPVLFGGNIYFGFGSGDENLIWHGWILKYDEATLSLQATYNTTSGHGIATGAVGGGIWMGSLSSDGTDIYAGVGNGTYDLSSGGPDAGQSIIKLDANFNLVDWTTPGNVSTTNALDQDVNCIPMLVDSTHLACASKDGCGWVVTTANMGHQVTMTTVPPSGCAAATQQVWQVSAVTASNHSGVYGGAYCPWGSLYYPVADLPIIGYSYSAGTLNPTSFGQTAGNYAAAALACSSLGTANGIVWAATPGGISAFGSKQPVGLSALNASTLAVIASWTGFGNYSKWAQPTIDGNGKVFLPTDQGIVVLGF